MNKTLNMRKKLSQGQIIALGFFLIIAVGTCLLMLPIASREHGSAGFLDALFTSTSATCVTGLVIGDTFQKWSLFGQIVILLMIQIGGLGFVTIGVFFSIFLRRNIGLKTRGLLQESVNTMQIAGVVRLVKKIIIGTVVIEAAGAVILTVRFTSDMHFTRALYYGIFHAVSAFCNAGFDLMGRKEAYSSFMSYYGDGIVNVTIMSLIVIGGIGFIVWDDISRNKWNIRKYMLHTKIVLISTGLLIFGGAFLFWVFERNGLMAHMSLGEKMWSSLFSSVTARTAGFNTIDTAGLSPASKMLTIMLMFIGGSPGSTAGGIKTTTLVVILVHIWSNLRNSHGCNILGRRLEDDVIKKAGLVFFINLFLAFLSAMAICAIQVLPIEDVLFEVVSAIGTVGMSTGITRELTSASRIIIIFLMYCGRIGSMAFALSFTERKKSVPVRLPAGRITVG